MMRDARQTEFEAQLLSAARADDCPTTSAAEAWERFEQGLVAASSALAHTAVACARGTPSDPHDPGEHVQRGVENGSTIATRRGWPAWVWSLISAFSAAALTVLAMRALSSEPAREAAPPAQPSSVAPALAAPAPAAPSAETAAARAETDAPAAIHLRRTRAGVARGAPQSRDSAEDLRAQVALIDQARGALAAGRSGRVLALVRRFHARYPHAALTPDAEVLAIEALAAQGAHREMAQRARAFLDAHPYDPHSARVRALLRQHADPRR